MDRPIVITGVAGFLGCHLAKRLLREGARVIGIDNFTSAGPGNLDWLRAHKDFSFFHQDICAGLPTQALDARPSQIYNLACLASPAWYTRFPKETLDVCSRGVDTVVWLAKQTGARLLQASTSEVYGDPLIHPQKEEYFGNVNPYGPRSMYDEGKRFAEARLFVARHAERVNTAIVRIFNTYGPRMRPDDGRVISAFIHAVLEGRKPPVHGDGQQTRSYCYVDDMVEGLIRMMESGEEGPMNLGNPGEFTILELIRCLGHLLDRQLAVEHLPARPDDPKRRCPDIALARAQLSWEPKISLLEGLKRTLRYFHKERIADPID